MNPTPANGWRNVIKNDWRVMAAFPKYPPLPVPADKVRLICAGEPRLVTAEDRVTERRTADGRRQWKVPCMLGVAGEQTRSEIVQVTVCQDEAPRVEFGERLEADELVVLFWGMERDGEAYAGLSFRAERLAAPGARKPQNVPAAA
jgi:hypothetical protein